MLRKGRVHGRSGPNNRNGFGNNICIGVENVKDWLGGWKTPTLL